MQSDFVTRGCNIIHGGSSRTKTTCCLQHPHSSHFSVLSIHWAELCRTLLHQRTILDNISDRNGDVSSHVSSCIPWMRHGCYMLCYEWFKTDQNPLFSQSSGTALEINTYKSFIWFSTWIVFNAIFSVQKWWKKSGYDLNWQFDLGCNSEKAPGIKRCNARFTSYHSECDLEQQSQQNIPSAEVRGIRNFLQLKRITEVSTNSWRNGCKSSIPGSYI